MIKMIEARTGGEEWQCGVFKFTASDDPDSSVIHMLPEAEIPTDRYRTISKYEV